MTNYTLLNKEIEAIHKTPKEISSMSFKLILHTKDKDITINLFESIEIKADFNNNVGDINFINFNMGAGDYTYDVFAYRNNLEMTVIKYINKKPYENRTYKAILHNTGNNYNNAGNSIKKEDLNKAEMVRVKLQLLDKPLELLRGVKVDGIFNNNDIKNMLIPLIKDNISKIGINGQKLKPIINIVEPDNKKKYNNILIPTGTKLLEVPTYLQDTRYGVYMGDIGVYIKNIRLSLMDYQTCFFMYPLYTKQDDIFDNLYIYHSDGKLNKTSDNTYTYKNKALKIITSEMNVIETGERNFMNTGASITSSSMDNITNYNTSVGNDNIGVNKKSQLSNESYKTEDGMVNEHYVGNEINLYKHYSRINNQDLDLYQFKWMYSDHTRLLPGMNVTLFYQIEKEIKTLKGVLQGYFTVYNETTKVESTLLMIKLGEVK